MATGDQQVLVTGQAPTPATFRIPGNGQLRPKVVYASFDGSGAAGDFLPCLRFISDAGEVVGESASDETVAAGGSADTSWFPRVAAGASSSPPSLTWRTQHGWTSVGQVVTSGVAQAIKFDAGTIFDANARPLIGNGGSPATITSVFDYEVSIGLVVQWPAGAYDRYIEIVDPSFDTSAAPITWRSRGSLTPDADIQTVFAIVDGNELAPRAIQFNCFQASGVNKTISRWVVASTIPYLRPPGINQ